MQPEDLLQGLGLAVMQVRCVIVEAEQQRHVEPIPLNAVLAAALSRISSGLLISNVPTFSRYLMVRSLQVNEKNSFAGIPATGGAGASLVTPGSKAAPFWATAAGLSRWKISLFVHLAPPWQEAQLASKTAAPAARLPGCG